MYPFWRSLLFQLDPESAHAVSIQLMRLGGFPPFNALLKWMYFTPQKPVQAFGLTFPNAIGLAAGYDKDGVAFQGLSALGFGHVEVGTVTPRPQAGNPSPRVFRLREDQAIINRMGFPGKGMDFVRRQLLSHAQPRANILGVNLGKNKETPLEEAVSDYLTLMRAFAPLADYLTINISSPNTAGLRRLQGRVMLESLLTTISAEKAKMPVLVKLAPDLTSQELDDALDVILRAGMDGVIATNTTLARDGLRSPLQRETGGLSGYPLAGRSETILTETVKRLNGRIPVISVGGIMHPNDARRRLDLGATLVQVYTGLVYAGPGLAKRIVLAT